MTIPANKTLQENFRWRVETSPNNIAHKFLDRETSFLELDFLSNKVANGILEEGCKKDARVAYLGKNSCLLYTSPSPRDRYISRMPSSA